MLHIFRTKQFRKDSKKILKQGKDLSLIVKVIDTLQAKKPLPKQNCDHELTGNWKGYRECHVQSDLLLIYQIEGDILILSRTGSHSELF